MYLLSDIGGTKIRIAFTKDGKKFSGKPFIFNTPKKFEDGMKIFKRALEGKPKPEGTVCGIAGSLNPQKSRLRSSPNLPGWAGKPLKEELEKITGAGARLENDAAAAGLGEARSGAGKKRRIVAYITVSTGVGGARIVDGRIDRNASGFEPGQQIVELGDKRRVAGKSGRLESFISGPAMRKKYGRNPAKIKNKSAWEEEARILAAGLCNTVRFWSPDVIILGGSMMTKKVGIPLARVEHYLAEMLGKSRMPKLAKAKLGDYSGLYGAMALLRQDKNK
jgi:predicted NBD/HSP70 family sugar kinase